MFTTAYLFFLVFFVLVFFFFVAGFSIAFEAAWPSTVGREFKPKGWFLRGFPNGDLTDPHGPMVSNHNPAMNNRLATPASEHQAWAFEVNALASSTSAKKDLITFSAALVAIA